MVRSADLSLPPELAAHIDMRDQKAIPALAHNRPLLSEIERLVQTLNTDHLLVEGDSRNLSFIRDESVELALTSPPYWTLKQYRSSPSQLGDVQDYDRFLTEIDKVWTEIFRALLPGGRLIVVVGDVCLSRRRFGRHVAFPLHSSIQEHCRAIGFDNLTPIIWHKIANMKLEVENGSSFLGKPYEPNGVIKNDIEYILFLRKPGGYRQPSDVARILSTIPADKHKEWFQQIWTLTGASTRNHPAPYPIALAERLIRMFSFVGDTVLDPFSGTGTTSAAARLWGRNSIGVEIEPTYVDMARKRLGRELPVQAALQLAQN